MKTMRVVIKLGGSLLSEAPELIDRLVKEFGSGTSGAASEKQVSERNLFSILIVPGGGVFADAVRRADETCDGYGFNNRTASRRFDSFSLQAAEGRRPSAPFLGRDFGHNRCLGCEANRSPVH